MLAEVVLVPVVGASCQKVCGNCTLQQAFQLEVSHGYYADGCIYVVGNMPEYRKAGGHVNGQDILGWR